MWLCCVQFNITVHLVPLQRPANVPGSHHQPALGVGGGGSMSLPRAMRLGECWWPATERMCILSCTCTAASTL